MKLLSAFFVLLICNVYCQNPDKPGNDAPGNPLPADTIPAGLLKLQSAYPDFISGVTPNSLVFKDGTSLPYDENLPAKDYAGLLSSADLKTQMSQVYHVGALDTPTVNYDPGRMRNEAFFKKMYGSTQEAVKRNLTEIMWLPKTNRQRILVTKVNGVNIKIKEISDILDTMPQFIAYLKDIGGTFNWRTINGTKRLSTHSFGMTIDINASFSNYWQWDCKCTDENKKVRYQNQIPPEIVRVFEEHGFIWGGRWYHYDSMHFEYRPELLK